MALALPLLAMGLSAAGAISSAQNQASQYRQQAQAEQYNADINAMAARNAAAAGNANEEAQRRKAAIAEGSQRAALTQSGMDINSGTGSDLVAQSMTNDNLDALNIRYQGQQQAWSYQTQSNLDNYKAKANLANASSATGAGMYIGAASAALTTGAAMYGAGKK